MRIGSGPSWQIRISDPFEIFFALYVRASAGLVGAEDVPPLTPAVHGWSTMSSERQTAVLTEQWMKWWTALFAAPSDGARHGGTDGPDFPLTIGAPELRAAQQAVLRPACDWRSANRWDEGHSDETAALMPTHLVAELERETGRHAPPFVYEVEVIRVDGAWCRDLSPTRVLLSENLSSDTEAFRETLRPRLTALLTD
jgi:hypothetical protein